MLSLPNVYFFTINHCHKLPTAGAHSRIACVITVISDYLLSLLAYAYTSHLTQYWYLNGHDTCNDWYSDSNASTVGVELQESLRFKEKLCDDEISTCVYLLFEVLKILLIRGTVRVTVGVTWRGRERCD